MSVRIISVQKLFAKDIVIGHRQPQESRKTLDANGRRRGGEVCGNVAPHTDMLPTCPVGYISADLLNFEIS